MDCCERPMLRVAEEDCTLFGIGPDCFECMECGDIVDDGPPDADARLDAALAKSKAKWGW